MARLRLYSNWVSSCSYRVRIALNLKNIEYDYVPVDLNKKEQINHPRLTGLKQVPVLHDTLHDLKISQSMAILRYVDGLSEELRLFPEDHAGRARVCVFKIEISWNLV